jgi:hypothetical protein
VPSGAQTDYAHYNLYAQLYPNAYQNYKPPTGKAQFCESTFYLGNTYQQGEVTAYKQMVSQLAAAGHAQSNFIVENSNNSTATQLSQLQSEINSGCNVIFLDAGSTTAFCSLYSTALQKNIAIVSLDPVYCNNAITVSFDVYQNSYELAANLYKAMNYQGNLLYITGVPGVADAATATAAANAAAAGHPGLGCPAGNVAVASQPPRSEGRRDHRRGRDGRRRRDGTATGRAPASESVTAGGRLPGASVPEGESFAGPLHDGPGPGAGRLRDHECGAAAPGRAAACSRHGPLPDSRPDHRDIQSVVHTLDDDEQLVLRIAEAGPASDRELPRSVLHRRPACDDLPGALLITELS